MKTEQEILDMIKHFEGHAKDPEESLEQQIRYHGMAEALKMVLE